MQEQQEVRTRASVATYLVTKQNQLELGKAKATATAVAAAAKAASTAVVEVMPVFHGTFTASASAATDGKRSKKDITERQHMLLEKAKRYQAAVVAYGSGSSEAQILFESLYHYGYRYAVALSIERGIGVGDAAEDIAQLAMVRFWKRLTVGNETIFHIPWLILHSFHCEYVNWVSREHSQARRPELIRGEEETANRKRILPPKGFARNTNGQIYEYGYEAVTTNAAAGQDAVFCLALVDSTGDVFVQLERKELKVALYKALAELPNLYQMAAIGFLLEGKSHKELMAEHDWTLDQSKKYVKAAKGLLAQALLAAGYTSAGLADAGGRDD